MTGFRVEIVVTPPNDIERAIIHFMSAASGADQVDLGASVAELTGDSVIALQMMRRIARHFGAPSIATEADAVLPITTLAAKIAETASGQNTAAPIARNLASFGRPGGWADDEEHPLTPGMAGLWFLHRLSPQSAVYVDPHFLRIRAPVSADALMRTFQLLVERHASLRAVFGDHDGIPFFRVLPEHRMDLHFHDVSDCDEEELGRRLSEAAARPFDLATAPPFTAHLFTRAADDHLFLLAGHHILWDYASDVTILGEFNAVYPALAAGDCAPDLGPADDIRDYVAWYNKFMDREGDRQWSYWRRELEGAEPFINLPVTKQRPESFPHLGGSIRFQISEDLVFRLLELAKSADATLHAVLLAALELVLARYANQSSLCIASIMSGRTKPELQRVVGYLVNPVVIRADLSGDPSAWDVLGKAAKAAKYAFANQYFPFAWTVGRMRKARDPGRSPFQQVVFVLQQSEGLERQELAAMVVGDETAKLNFGGLPAETFFHQDPHAQFDLSFVVSRTKDSLRGVLQYSADMFSAEAMQVFLADFMQTLDWIVIDPGRRLSELPLSGPQPPQAEPRSGAGIERVA